MGAFLDGLGKVFGKVADQVQGRIERLKNEKEKLLNERKALLDKNVTPAAAARVNVIDGRLCQINTALAAKAAD